MPSQWHFEIILFSLLGITYLDVFETQAQKVSWISQSNDEQDGSSDILEQIRSVTGNIPSHLGFCGGKRHALISRVCYRNDSICGFWDKRRFFHPLTCRYRDISSEMARKCLGNRTLAFIGDSQIRDIAVGVAYLLLGQSLSDALEEKFDYKHKMESNATKIDDFPHWKNNVLGHNYNGHIFPLPEIAEKYNYKWQVQMWSLYSNKFIDNQVDDVLTHKTTKLNKLLRPIDLAFWSHGLHDWGWWSDPPYAERYYEQVVGRWLAIRKRVPVPTVWVTMNPECEEKLNASALALAKRIANVQVRMVEEANWYVNRRMKNERLPLWDAAAALRVPDRCAYSNDGLHVKMFVDIMRAKMLFNHLCDNNLN